MNDFTEALYTAASLIGHRDAELVEIVSLSLAVSLTAASERRLCSYRHLRSLGIVI